MHRGHRHGLRALLLAAAGAAAWWYLTDPASAAGADWGALVLAVLAAQAGWALARLTVTFFAGPAWWVALVTDRVRAGHRWRVAHGELAWWEAWWSGDSRPAIPAWLHRAVLAADRHACIYCGAAGVVLHWDHLKPWDRGGLTSPWNGGTLCAHHNLVKCDVWVYPRGARPGALYYNGSYDPGEALAILTAVRRRRRHPVRLARLLVACLAG